MRGCHCRCARPLPHPPRPPQAKVYQARAYAEADEAARRAEETDRAYAARVAQAEEDEVLAAKLAEHLEQEARRAKAAREADEAAGLALAERLSREEEESARALQEQAEADGALALKAQQAEADALRRRIEQVCRHWRHPRLQTRNVEAGVMVITTLPMLRGVRVSADRDGAELTVTAVPDFSSLLPDASALPKGMSPPPESVDVALDLKIVGKAGCSEEDIEVSYDKATGKCRVLVRGAYVSKETAAEDEAAAGAEAESEAATAAEDEADAEAKTGLFARIRRGLHRVFSSGGGESQRDGRSFGRALSSRSTNSGAPSGRKSAGTGPSASTGRRAVAL